MGDRITDQNSIRKILGLYPKRTEDKRLKVREYPHIKTNIGRNKGINALRFHVKSGACLIITGFSDILSTLALIAREIVPEIKDNLNNIPEVKIRILIGADTRSTQKIVNTIPVEQKVKEHFLNRSGVIVENTGDMVAVILDEWIERRDISVRLYNREIAKEKYRISNTGLMHVKGICSDLGYYHTTGNVTRGGLLRNLELGTAELSSGAERDAREYAEVLWNCGEDYNDKILELLKGIIQLPPPGYTAARALAEKNYFIKWRPTKENQIKQVNYELLDFQSDVVYNIIETVHEFGFCLLCAPVGSGKTAIGKMVCLIFAASVRMMENLSVSRGGQNVLVIMPAKVSANWKGDCIHRVTPDNLRKKKIPEDFIAILADESHHLSGWSTKRSKDGEYVMASVRHQYKLMEQKYSISLSATISGSTGLADLIAHQENRASLWTSSQQRKLFLQIVIHVMGDDILRQPWLRWDKRFANAIISKKHKIAEYLDPYMVRLCIDDVGIHTEELNANEHFFYPRIVNHGRSSELDLDQDEIDFINELNNQVSIVWKTGGSYTKEEGLSRIGEYKGEQTAISATARNLMVIFGACPEIGRAKILYELEQKESEYMDEFELFPEENPFTKLSQTLKSPLIGKMQLRICNYILALRKKHDRILFYANDVVVLMYYAHFLAESKKFEDVRVCATTVNNQVNIDVFASAVPNGIRLNEGKYLFSFGVERKSSEMESLYSKHGENIIEGSCAALMTFENAEGVNLQSCDTSVFFGVSSVPSDGAQAFGRTYRIDSEYADNHFYLCDIKRPVFRSDKNAVDRIENHTIVERREVITPRLEEIQDDPSLTVFNYMTEYTKNPRSLSKGNLPDIKLMIKQRLDQKHYMDAVERVVKGEYCAGPWVDGLDGLEGNTLLFYAGVSNHILFSTPRLLRLTNDGNVVNDEIANWRMLLDHIPDDLSDYGPISKDVVLNILGNVDLDLVKNYHFLPQGMLECLVPLHELMCRDSTDDLDMFCESMSLRTMTILIREFVLELRDYLTKAQKDLMKELSKNSAEPPELLSWERVITDLYNDPKRANRLIEKLWGVHQEHDGLYVVYDRLPPLSCIFVDKELFASDISEK